MANPKYSNLSIITLMLLIILFGTKSLVFAYPITSEGLGSAWESGGDAGAWSYVDGNVSLGATLFDDFGYSLGEIVYASFSGMETSYSKGEGGESWTGIDATLVEDGVLVYSISAGIGYNPPTPAIPEPASILLVAFGMAGLAGFRKKFRKR